VQLQSIKPSYPLQIVAVDIVGPFPESEDRNKYILVACEYFTRGIWYKNQEAETVSQKLTDNFFFRFWLPEQLHSDQDEISNPIS
jgi:hypothetical protein